MNLLKLKENLLTKEHLEHIEMKRQMMAMQHFSSKYDKNQDEKGERVKSEL